MIDHDVDLPDQCPTRREPGGEAAQAVPGQHRCVGGAVWPGGCAAAEDGGGEEGEEWTGGRDRHWD